MIYAVVKKKAEVRTEFQTGERKDKNVRAELNEGERGVVR